MAGRALAGVIRAVGIALMLGCWMTPAQATPTDAAEIDRLIEALGGSECRFERNGKWYDGAEARAHLQRKYDWLRRRGLADSSEQFIERAASRSSISGRPYHVQCPGQPRQPAADWFQQQLRELRAAPE